MAVARCSFSDVRPGSLGALFRGGAQAVVVDDDPRIAQLWQRLQDSTLLGGTYPWDQPLMQLARNHRAGDMHLGDMARFVNGGIGHIARKIAFAPEGDRMRVYPRIFWDGDTEVEIDQDLLWATWDLASSLFKGVVSGNGHDPRYALTLELLRYPDCSSSLDAVLDLMHDSSDGWTRVGRRLDGYKNKATSTFDLPAIRLRDWFAFGSLVPGLRHVLHGVNDLADGIGNNTLPQGYRVIGGAHIDGTKALTLLLSDRSVISTEIRHDGRWLPLPLSTESIAIMPARDIDKYSDLTPTLHRVLMKTAPKAPGKRMNLTVAICVIDHARFARVARNGSR